MIVKASQRAGGQQLATHLRNELDNDRVEVADVRGAIANDLHGAFAEWSAIASATKCRKYLYSLSVNPDPDQGPLTRAQYVDFIERTEKKLGLAGQPRVLVFHVKHGREHAHVIWSRIDSDRLRAVQLSNDRYKLRTVTREFARDHGLELPAGMADRDAQTRRRRPETHAEKQQEERAGETREQRMRTISEAWRKSGDASAFVRALTESGYALARGDSRAYVVVDHAGEVHSLARQIDGVRTKDVKARLGSAYPLDDLPAAAVVQKEARQRAQLKAATRADFKKAAADRRTALGEAHQQRRNALDQRRESLEAQHRVEREALAEAQEDESKGVVSQRLASRPRPVLAFLARVTGIRTLIDYRQRRQDQQRAGDHAQQRAALERRHGRELLEFAHHYRALARVETYEKRSLETSLRREQFQRAAQARTLTPLQQAFMDARRAQTQGRDTPPSPTAGAETKRLSQVFEWLSSPRQPEAPSPRVAPPADPAKPAGQQDELERRAEEARKMERESRQRRRDPSQDRER